ncbi:MAG: glycoside hydrolase family 97 protein [Rikenellaceae bacterium]
MKREFLIKVAVAVVFISANLFQVQGRDITVSSPDGETKIVLSVDSNVSFSAWQDGVNVVAPSKISMTLSDGTVWGEGAQIAKVAKSSVDKVIESSLYTHSEVRDNYNEAVVNFKGDWAIAIRAYDDGVAYRFISKRKGDYEIESELSQFLFSGDVEATVPYVPAEGNLERQLFQSFENTYVTEPISALDKNRLMMMPLSVAAAQGKRVTITEADLRNYPGMYITSQIGRNALVGYYPQCRDDVQKAVGHNNLQVKVKSRHNYIAKVSGEREFPWRVAIITRKDADLAATSMVYKLAEANVIGDTSWIKPGKVAWDWWCDWNLEGVDFKAGINNQTYKYFIDFASENGLEYVILDEGWAVNKACDLMQVVPEIDIQELVDYGTQRGVGIILWAGYHAFDRDMELVTKHYSQMGVKGFKVDFMNSDDQEMVYFNERAAAMAAKYEMMLDFHGVSKPTGLERTYPNIVNYESVHGLEHMKWQPQSVDQVSYDVSIPYLRMVAGPIDYTQGAMKNAVYVYNTRINDMDFQYTPNYTAPMSQGTRARQLAQYVVFFSPLSMLCDTPTAYQKNPISTEYIASMPTVWDETRIVDGVMGEYIVTARRSGDRWYIGALTNWDARSITVDVEAITGKSGAAILYKDGPNATTNGQDFQRVEIEVDGEVTIDMAPGGGFALIL